MGELLEAGQAADEAAGAPGAKEEAADGEDPTLGLDLVLDIGQHLGGVGRGVAVVIKRQSHPFAASSTRHLHPLFSENQSWSLHCHLHRTGLRHKGPVMAHRLIIGRGRYLTILGLI